MILKLNNMKIQIKLFYALFIPALILSGCKPAIDIEKEKTAIKEVIKAETKAFYDKNSKAFQDLYIQDTNQTRVMLVGSDLSVTTGWAKMKVMVDSIPFYNWSAQKNFKFNHDFISIKVIGDVAWAIVKYTSNYTLNDVSKQDTDLQTIVLEKIGGNWKISCFVISTLPPPQPISLSGLSFSKVNAITKNQNGN